MLGKPDYRFIYLIDSPHANETTNIIDGSRRVVTIPILTVFKAETEHGERSIDRYVVHIVPHFRPLT